MNYKTNFAFSFDLFMDRMSYVYDEYTKVMNGKQPMIWIWKTMWQYYFTFMMDFMDECKKNWVNPLDRWEVFDYFDNFSREPHILDQWYKYDYWSNESDEYWSLVLTPEQKEKSWYFEW